VRDERQHESKRTHDREKGTTNGNEDLVIDVVWVESDVGGRERG
jgi:hypothetical protein